MALSSDDYKSEMNKLMEEWTEKHRNDDYDPVPFLTKLSERFEKETEDFHKQDPDPFDDRHPMYTMPNCPLGKLLKALTKHDEFLTDLISKYLKSRSGPIVDKESNEPRPSLSEAAARLLLVIMPGLDTLSIFTDNNDVMPLLYRWSKVGAEPLRTYATGLLASAAEHQDINNQHNRYNAALVPVLLKRMWNYIQPGKYPPDQSDAASLIVPVVDQATSTRDIETISVNIGNEVSDVRKSSNDAPSTSNSMSNKKRKLSGDFAKKSKCRKTSEKILAEDNLLNIHKDLCVQYPGPTRKLAGASATSTVRGRNEDNETVPSASDVIDISEASNSSWVEMMPVVIGCSYTLAPPLPTGVCERFILNLLIPLGEYQDLLSHFLEYNSLDLIKKYLDKSSTNDGLLTFYALRFLSSLLCHNKIATGFIEDNGVQRLLSVRRPSIGATGVSLCIYYLAYNHDAMERVCQLPSKVLHDLVKYATWLLECSHDSGQCHAALFFNISFQFHVILKLFDQRNGLRYLLNMLSMLPIIRLEDEQSSKEDSDTYRQTARTTCQALRKYFETHLVLKAMSTKEQLHVAPSNQQQNSSKVIECDRENVLEYLDFLLGLEQPNALLPMSLLTNWHPIQSFMKLDGVRLLLRLIALACDWTNYWGRADTVRFALDCLAVVTLSPKSQLQLCENVNLPPSLTEETGISIILGVAEGEAYLGSEPEAQKSALNVLINCVCGSQYKFDGAMGRIINGTPQARIVSKSMDECRQKLWECVKTNNGIKVLLQLLITTQPVFHADDIRLLACKALCGLSRCKSVKQIMSKLPMFNNGQLQALTRQPVMRDRRRLHDRFCKYVEELTERVSGKPSTLHMDLDSLRKAHIVSQTMIRYDNRELLQLIHNHLAWSGLHSSACMLAREASLHIPTTSSTAIFSTPRNHMRTPGASGDASYVSPVNRKISFSKGTHAQGETPTLHSYSSTICTPNQKKSKTKIRFEMNGSGDIPTNFPSHYRLSSHGQVTVMEKGVVDVLGESSKRVPTSPTTLNTIVAEYLKNQHSHCKNPVVTVPEFSLLRPHYCPEPRFRVEAPLNIGARCMRRQVAPRCGGVGGASCDRHFIYSRFRPHIIFRAPDEERIPYTSCAFTPDDMSIVLGNYQGDLTVRSIVTDHERVIEGCANASIVKVEPSKDGSRLLIVEEGVWRHTCSLFSMTSMEVKRTYSGISYIEFSKTSQDKVIGTKNSSAIIYDAESGQVLHTLERPDLASHYSNNKATFSTNDEMVLSDGVLWDIRASGNRPIHKFDKFNANMSGVFHPQGLEVIINTEIWDLRNYNLLHTVPTIDQCTVHFNKSGTILYAAKSVEQIDMEDRDEENVNTGSTTFMAIDAHDYGPLSVTDTKHKIYDVAVDGKDCYVAVIEREQGLQQYWDGPSMSLCRLYEVGRMRGEDEEDEQEDENVVDDDDDNNDDNDANHDNSDNFSDDGTGSSYDTPSFAISLSSNSSREGRRRRRPGRRRMRRRRLSGSSASGSLLNLSDDGWSTMDDESLLSFTDDEDGMNFAQSLNNLNSIDEDED